MDTNFISTRRIVAVLAAGAFGMTAPLAVSSLSHAAVHGHVSSRDSDGDKMPNRWELKHGLDAHTPNAHRDADHDGLQNLAEFRDGTDPQDDDSDDDGVEDGDDDTPDCDEAAEDCTTDDCDQTGDDRAMNLSGDDCDETTSPSTRLVTYSVG
jgi:hypothetical protein